MVCSMFAHLGEPVASSLLIVRRQNKYVWNSEYYLNNRLVRNCTQGAGESKDGRRNKNDLISFTIFYLKFFLCIRFPLILFLVRLPVL